MKVGVMMSALQERKMILPAIHQFDNVGGRGMEDLRIDEIIVACSKTSWYGKESGDDTAELAVRAGATVRLHEWVDEKDQKNWIMDKFQDKDWILLFAPDMYMTTESINNLLYFLKNAEKRAYGCDMITYWKNYDTAIYPFDKFNTVAIRSQERFVYSSRINDFTTFDTIPGVLMHHLSWVRTDDEMKLKLKTWSHAPEVKKDWFKKVWKNWTPDMKKIGPIDPIDIQGTKEYNLPQEIRDLIKKYKI